MRPVDCLLCLLQLVAALVLLRDGIVVIIINIAVVHLLVVAVAPVGEVSPEEAAVVLLEGEEVSAEELEVLESACVQLARGVEVDEAQVADAGGRGRVAQLGPLNVTFNK